MKFICASDLHLGRKSSDCPDMPGYTALSALERIIRLANEREADWLLFAGDISDADENEFVCQSMLEAAFRELNNKTRIAVISGNHDEKALKKIVDRLNDSLRCHSRIVFLDGLLSIGEGLALAGFPYDSKEPDKAKKQLLKLCDRSVIALFHGDHAGASGKYACLYPQEQKALSERCLFAVCGHNHYPDRTYGNLLNCGSPQAFDFGDGGEKNKWHGVWFADTASHAPEFIPVSTAGYITVKVDIDTEDPIGYISEQVLAVCREAGTDPDACFACVRVEITGNSTGKRTDSLMKLACTTLNSIYIDRVTDCTLPFYDPEDNISDRTPDGVLCGLLTGGGGYKALRQELLKKVYDEVKTGCDKFLAEYDMEFSEAETEELFDEKLTDMLRAMAGGGNEH